MLEWIIIGGGFQGTLLSRVLTADAAVPLDRVVVLDPHEAPLSRFFACTKAVGMDFLRSSIVHHLDGEPGSLRRFAEEQGYGSEHLLGPYLRPSLELFAAHCEAVVARDHLAPLRAVATARAVERSNGHLVVESDRGRLETRRVAFALGGTERPLWPSWASKLAHEGARVRHIFDDGYSHQPLTREQQVVVVGGGISAQQKALALSAEAPGRVCLLSRHSHRLHDFDIDSAWMGPRLSSTFARIEAADRRRQVIERERHLGSAPGDIVARFQEAVARGMIRHARGNISDANHLQGRAALALEEGRTVDADLVLLATGFSPERPGGEWLDRTILRLGLQCASCGYPVVDNGLRWAPGIHVAGPLAELEIGPTARNIHGARLAGKRLLRVANS